jgi:hypothetical protein
MDVREKLVELLDDMQRSGTGYFGSAIENKKIADYLIRHGVTVQDWVSVKDRLPDEHESLFARYKDTDKWRNAMFTTISDRVIVCAEYENGKRIVKTANTVDGVWKVKDIFHPCKVTHWMPMPYPPKGE